MSYRDIIEDSQNGSHRKVAEIWEETTTIEQIGITSCKGHFKSLGYNISHEPKHYHPQYDLKFEFKDDELTVEVKTELNATGVFDWDARTFDTCFVEYLDDASKHPKKLTGLSLTEATFYWFHTGGGIFQVPTEQLKAWGKSGKVKHTKGGINKSSTGFKLPISWMAEYEVTN